MAKKTVGLYFLVIVFTSRLSENKWEILLLANDLFDE